MNRRLHILFALTSVLLWAVLVSACQPESRSQASQPTATPSTPAVLTITAVSTSNDTSARLPPCQFTQDMSATASSLQTTSLDKFVFAKPTVVLTSSEDISTLDVVQWLPDNRRLLIKQVFSRPRHITLEVLGTVTGESKVYAQPHTNGGSFWLTQQQAVVYSEDVAADKTKGQWRTEWWMSEGDPDKAQRLVADMPDYLASFDVNRQQVLQWQTNKTLPYSLDNLSSVLPLQEIPFNPEQWIYRKYPEAFEPVFEPASYSFAASSRADGSLIAFYGNPWLFLFDTRTNHACEVDLGDPGGGPWRATRAHWSPSGRYLAMDLLSDLPGQMATNWRIMILDTFTGTTYQPSVYDEMAWVPNQDHILMMDDFTLIDVTTGNTRKLAEESEFKDMKWAAPHWASNGQTIAADCFSHPPIRESGICLMTVTTQP